MSLKNIANAALTLDHKSGSPISGGAFVVTSTPSTTVKSDGQGVHIDPLTFTFSGGSATGFVSGSVSGDGSIPATAEKVKAGGVLVMRKSDFATMNCTGTVSPPATPPTAAISGPVEISDAGQTKAKAQ